MAEYVLLIHCDETAYTKLDDEAGKQLYAGHLAFMDAAKEAGVPIPYSAELEWSGTARTVAADGTVTDGPYAETKEQLGGFYVIEVDTMEEAVRWGAKIPMLPGDRVEVRPGK